MSSSSPCFDQERPEHPVSPTFPTIAPPLFPCRPGTSILVQDSRFEGSLAVTKTQAYRWNGRQYTRGGLSGAIDLLPDVVLLEIFDSYVDKAQAWQTLVHVCRTWRNVVFGSPQRLDLRLYCNAKTPVREMPDIWPPLPIVLSHSFEKSGRSGHDNIIAALEHNNRIRKLILLRISSSQLEKVLATIQQPFPALKNLELGFEDEAALPVVDPDLFLGGSALGLQKLRLECIPFPRLPKLLLSATHLVKLHLMRIPHSGYISPDEMVTCLSVLTRLDSLVINFKSPQSCPDRRSRFPPPPTRTLLSVLTHLWFVGVSEYLEDFLARIDAPLLKSLWIKFFHQLIFDTPQFTQFVYRTPKFKAHDIIANVNFSDSHFAITTQAVGAILDLGISCSQSDWQLSSLAQVCSSSSLQSLIPAVKYLHFEDRYLPRHWQDDIEGDQWLEVLHPFIAVTDLYISQEFLPRIMPALRELTGERVAEVLPALPTLFLDDPHPPGPVQEAIEQFVAARQLTGHPIAISQWEREWEIDSEED